jgi:trk system potassium uptake protein TrkA
MHHIAVIGLGRFGTALARQLAASGSQVIAIDSSPGPVEEIKDQVPVAVRLDSTDDVALKSQNIDQVDVAVVAIGENFEAALLTTVILKKLGIPKIICRAQSAFHSEIFLQIGAHQVIQPELQSGEHLGRQLANPRVDEFIKLGEGFSLIELHAPRQFIGKSLKDLALRQSYGVNLVAIKRNRTEKTEEGEITRPRILAVLDAEEVICDRDVLVLVGSDDALSKLPQE